jgi:cell division protein ZapA (FtsZ GTPase activity inhibitor)
MDQSITLKIVGKDYPLKAASPEMEQVMRVAAEAINKRLAQYDAKFPDKDVLDKLVFVTLNETISRIATQRKLAAREEGEKKLLDEMTSYLDSIEKSSR